MTDSLQNNEDINDYKDSSAHGIEMMRALLPSVQQFVHTVKMGIENPNLETGVQSTNASDMQPTTTATLRVVAEKMEEFAANLGKVSAFIRLATNRFGPNTLDAEKSAVEKILSTISSEQVAEISRYMDRNYIGKLDHERGAVVSGRYVGAIPRIKDALALLVESLEMAEQLLRDKTEAAPLTLAEQTFGEEASQLFQDAEKVSPFGPMGGVFSPTPAAPFTPLAPDVSISSDVTTTKNAADEEGGALQPQLKPSVHPELLLALSTLNELLVVYTDILKSAPNETALADVIKALQTAKTTLYSIHNKS